MASSGKIYRLYRGPKPIEVERVENYFTVALDRRDGQSEERARNALADAKVSPERYRHLGVYDLKVTIGPENLAPVLTSFNKEHHLVTQHAYRPINSSGTRYYLGDSVFVRVKGRIGRRGVRELLSKYGIDPESVSDLEGTSSDTVIAKASDTMKRDVLELAAELSAEDGVVFAEPDMIERFQGYSLAPSNDSFDEQLLRTADLFGYQWYLESRGCPLLQRFRDELIEDAGISITEAWRRMGAGGKERGSSEVIVGLMDEGFNLDHPNLGRDRCVEQLNLEDVGIRATDVDPQTESAGHGTPCAGLAIAGGNGQGVTGVAPACKFIVARKKLEGRVSDMQHAFWELGRRADILSWSFSVVPSRVPLHSILDDVFTRISESGAMGKGCVLCFAAGNWNAPLDAHVTDLKWRKKPTNESPEEVYSGHCLNGYASHPAVLSIAACTSTGRRAAYSNFGDPIALCAPSNNFDPLEVDKVLPGLGIVTADNEIEGSGYNPGSLFTGLRGRTSFGGTSAATPLVAGVAALVRSVNPALPAARVRDLLRSTAQKIGTEPGGDAAEGTRGQYNNGHSQWFGHGRVHAAAAVKAAFETLGRTSNQ